MKYRPVLYGFALFAIFIICMLPVSASIQISSIDMVGQDGVSAKRRASDYTKIKVVILNDGSDSEITPDQLKFGATGLAFSEPCFDTAEGTVCMYTEETRNLREADFMAGNTLTATVKLYDDTATVVDTRVGSINIDFLKPSIETFDIRQNPDGTVTADIKVVEKELTGRDTCSGFQSIYIKISDEIIYSVGLSELTDCTYEVNDLEIPVSGSGMTVFKLIAKDLVGQESVSSKQIYIDAQAPEFKELFILDSNYDVVEYLPSEEYIPLKVGLVFDEIPESIDLLLEEFSSSPSTVSLSSSQLNDGLTCRLVRSFPSISSPFSPEDYICFADVDAYMESSKSVSVSYEIYDSYSNVLTGRDVTSIVVDDSAPVVSYLGPSLFYESDNYLYVGPKTTFELLYTDVIGSGIIESDVYLYVSGYAGDTSKINGVDVDNNMRPADSCSDVRCAWNDIFVSSDNPSSFTFGLNAYSVDSSGNPVEYPTYTIKTDLDKPTYVVDSLSIENDNGESYYKIRDTVTIKLNLTDSGTGIKENVSIDFSNLNPDLTSELATCTELVDDVFECVFENLELTTPSLSGVEFKIYAFDNVGNELDNDNYNYVTGSISVFDVADSDGDNIASIYNAGARLSRQIMSVASTYVTVPFLVQDQTCVGASLNEADFSCTNLNDGVRVIDVNMVDHSCEVIATSDTALKSDLSDDELAFEEIFSIESPYKGSAVIGRIPLDLSADENAVLQSERLGFARFKIVDGIEPPAYDWVKYNCTVKISTFDLTTQKFYADEKVDFIFDLDFYDNPFGTLEENQNEELEKHIAIARDGLGWLDWFGGAYKIVKDVCSWWSALIVIVEGLAAIQDMIPWKFLGTLVEGTKIMGFDLADNFIMTACDIVECNHCRTSMLNSAEGTSIDFNSDDAEGYCKDIMEIECGSDSTALVDDKPPDICCYAQKYFCVVSGGFLHDWKTANFGESGGEYDAMVSSFSSSSIDPTSNMVAGVLFLCPSGILQGLIDIRELSCRKVKCLREIEDGRDPAYCDAEHAYNSCLYVSGEIMTLIRHILPGADLVATLTDFFKMIVEDPLGIAFGLGLKVLCKPSCLTGVGCFICSLTQFANILLRIWNTGKGVYEDIVAYTEGTNNPSFCEGLFDEDEDDE